MALPVLETHRSMAGLTSESRARLTSPSKIRQGVPEGFLRLFSGFRKIQLTFHCYPVDGNVGLERILQQTLSWHSGSQSEPVHQQLIVKFGAIRRILARLNARRLFSCDHGGERKQLGDLLTLFRSYGHDKLAIVLSTATRGRNENIVLSMSIGPLNEDGVESDQGRHWKIDVEPIIAMGYA